MKKIRRNVFETNSSSMHSLSIVGSDSFNQISGINGIINVGFGEFGWGYEELDTPIEKLSYVVTEYQYDCNKLKTIKEAIKDYTGCEMIITNEEGYIDHESQGMICEEITDKQSIIDIVFNDKYVIVIDNDNH